MTTINIAQDFSDTPLGRYHPNDGLFSGERFREEFLLPALQEGKVEVILDGTEGFGSSFLDEAFGGIVRDGHYTAQGLRDRLVIIANEADSQQYRTLVWKYIAASKPRALA